MVQPHAIPEHGAFARCHHRQLTFAEHGHILTNTGVWSPDGQWIVYDTRSDPAGDVFDGERIEMVHVETGEVRPLYQSRHGAMCGVTTWDPRGGQVVFILGPEHPTADFSYAACRRQGVLVATADPGRAINLDARDLTPPFTPGALRGGTHLHVFSPGGGLVSFTYEDHVLAQSTGKSPPGELNQRNIGVSLMGYPVVPLHQHPRNHAGRAFSVLVTRTTDRPRPGSDDISRACEEGWIGESSLAFQGRVHAPDQNPFYEVFVVDLPRDLTRPGDGPLQGTEVRRPFPPAGCIQRRLTFTAGRKYPGIQGPRHWLRCSPTDARIAFLMKDDAGVAQLWTVSPTGGEPRQLTHNPHPIASAFSWSPDGRHLAHAMDGSICITDAHTGDTRRLDAGSESSMPAPSPLACVFSPDGRKIACLRRVGRWNQVFVADAGVVLDA